MQNVRAMVIVMSVLTGSVPADAPTKSDLQGDFPNLKSLPNQKVIAINPYAGYYAKGAPQSLDGLKANPIDLDGLKSAPPAAWKSQPVANKLRAHQFSLPGKEAGKEAELVIYYFGMGGGGSTADNLKRWKDLFEPAKGKTMEESAKVDTFKVGAVPVTYLDVQGTFLKGSPMDPNAKIEKKADYRRIGVVFASPNGPYFITLTGPAATVADHKQAFDDWLKNFK